MKAVLPYFDSEWSFAQFRVSDNKTRVCFGSEQNTIYVISTEGNFFSAEFHPKNGGECLKRECINIFSVQKNNNN